MFACTRLAGSQLTLILALASAPLGCGDEAKKPKVGELVSVVAAGGEGAASLSHPDGAPAWSGVATLTVPSGARTLMLASLPELANTELAGAEIVLSSPGGARVVMGASQLTVTGLDQQDLKEPALEADLRSYVDAVRAELPPGFGEADLYDLLERGGALSSEASMPSPPAGLADRLAAYQARLAGLHDTVALTPGPRTAAQGLIIYGPEAGDWTLEVSVQEGAGAFEVRALALPGAFDLGAIEHMATALAAGAPSVVKAPQSQTGADPGCSKIIEIWRHPDPGTPEWQRAAILRAGWVLFEGVVVAGGVALATAAVVELIPVETAAAITAVFAITPEALIGAVTLAATVILNAATDFNNVAEDLYWRIAWTLSSPEAYGTVCWFGLAKGSPKAPWELAPGEGMRVQVAVQNPLKIELKYENWGQGGAGNPRPLEWASDPAEGVASLQPDSETHNAAVKVTAAEDPTQSTATLSVTMPTQPAKRDFAVSVEERTCTMENAVVEVGGQTSLYLDVMPPPPDDWVMEYQWTSPQMAGELRSKDGDAAPFTASEPFAVYQAGQSPGLDVASVTAVHVKTGDERVTLCKLDAGIDVVSDLQLDPSSVTLEAGQSQTFICRGCSGISGEHVFVWRTGGMAGALVGEGGTLVDEFESSTINAVEYRVSDKAGGGWLDWVSVTAYSIDLSGTRRAVGHASADIEVQKGIPPCKVTISAYEAPAGWVPDDGNPLDVECELAEGLHVIDPDSLEGCTTGRECEAQCLGWGDPQVGGFPIGWTTYDAEGEYTGSNNCGSPAWVASTCEGQLEWNKYACSANRDLSDDSAIAPCNCACGGGNCYPWSGPGKIVFHAMYNLPCTDTADCYYFHEPWRSEGSISFELVHCPWVEDALPNCPGHVPGEDL